MVESWLVAIINKLDNGIIILSNIDTASGFFYSAYYYRGQARLQESK